MNNSAEEKEKQHLQSCDTVSLEIYMYFISLITSIVFVDQIGSYSNNLEIGRFRKDPDPPQTALGAPHRKQGSPFLIWIGSGK